jgi:hypothetical protein
MFNSSKVCGWLDCVCVLVMHKYVGYGPFGRKGVKKEQELVLRLMDPREKGGLETLNFI